MEPILQRTYRGPFRWMLFIALARTSLIILGAWAIYYLRSHYQRTQLEYAFTEDILLVVFVLAQAWVYYFFRESVYKRQWAKLHVWLTATAVVMVPVLAVVLSIIVPWISPAEYMFRIMPLVFTIRRVLIIACLLIGNVFFVLNLRRSWTGNRQTQQDAIDAIGTDQ